ncbi:hypothetical protein K443DRAFT_5401 [Laccaria amethystina LaAM-08-1]|uniref:Unplaced genomic scaffold K443scaffold_45, whole genome shotgun sequence n=1 Tax=Laccaria amethystina LaAM-08-1 TaxID=1095629 RepID=A0A0C9WVH4_9AGAR|nr:hypothetical protein K443DRAFT_5401 [Laccaria amethystina LaAM-08-1]
MITSGSHWCGSKATAKAKHAETVSIPYDAVPGMDTNSREFRKAILVENAKAGNPRGKRARTEPPFIGGLAELQSLQTRAHAVVTKRMPGEPTLGYFKQQEVDLRERVLLSMQRLELELRLRDILVADYEIALAQIAERDPKGKSVAIN